MSYPVAAKHYVVNVDGFDKPEAYFYFTIDYTRLTEALATEIVNFHMDKEDLAFEADDDLETMLVLKTARRAYSWAITEDWNSRGLNAQFDKAEGWPGEGIIMFTTSHVDDIELCMDDLNIKGLK